MDLQGREYCVKKGLQDRNVSVTPDKAPPTPSIRRVRNRSFALSLTEIRKAASASPSFESRQLRDVRSARSAKSAKRKIVDWPEAEPATRNDGAVDESSKKIYQKYEDMNDFFHGLDCSIRLLKLKGSSATFSNISPLVDRLTDRKFTLKYLAQLKHLVPEVIEISKILVFDEKTSCMKPEIAVSFNLNHIVGANKPTDLRNIVRSRIVDFVESHPEGDEIPEEELPGPFNRNASLIPTVSRLHEMHSASCSSEDHVTSTKVVRASHFPPAFKRHFSLRTQAAIGESIEKTPVPIVERSVSNSVSSPATPSKQGSLVTEGSSSELCTPVKGVSPLSSNTPALSRPKRPLMSPVDNTNGPPKMLTKRVTRSRSLKFDIPDVKSEEDDMLSIISGNLLESLKENEKKFKEENDEDIVMAKRRRQMASRLPKLSDTIHYLFRHVNKAVLTKHELMSKIIGSNQEVYSDSEELDEQLEQLLELVPQWLSRKVTSTGDHLICINKSSSFKIIRSQLEAAI